MPFSSKKKIGNSNLTGATYMKLVLGKSRNLSEKLVKYGKQVFKCKKGTLAPQALKFQYRGKGKE